MIIQQLSTTEFRIKMTEDEVTHFQIITTGTDNNLVYDVPTLLTYILTWTEQHWYDTVKEPETDGH